MHIHIHVTHIRKPIIKCHKTFIFPFDKQAKRAFIDKRKNICVYILDCEVYRVVNSDTHTMLECETIIN